MIEIALDSQRGYDLHVMLKILEFLSDVKQIPTVFMKKNIVIYLRTNRPNRNSIQFKENNYVESFNVRLQNNFVYSYRRFILQALNINMNSSEATHPL